MPKPPNTHFLRNMMLSLPNDLPPQAVRLFYWLCEISKCKEEFYYPGHDPIGKLFGLDSRTVSKTIDDLCEAGVLEVKPIQVENKLVLKITNKLRHANPPLGSIGSLTALQQMATEPSGPHGRATSNPTTNQIDEEETRQKERMTPEERVTIVANSSNMALYLCHGLPVFRTSEPDLTQHTNSSWRRYGTAEDPKPMLWPIPAFAAYYWYLTTLWRERNSLTITLPVWGRLLGGVKNLYKTMPPLLLFRYIRILTLYFDVVQNRMGPIGQNMVLTEESLSHSMVKNATMGLLDLGQDAFEDAIDKTRGANATT